MIPQPLGVDGELHNQYLPARSARSFAGTPYSPPWSPSFAGREEERSLTSERNVVFRGADTLAVETVWLDDETRDTVRVERIDYVDSLRRDTTQIEYFGRR